MAEADEPVLVPVQRSGSPAGRRVRLVVSGWLLGLAGVAALGLSGHAPPPQAAIAPEATIAQLPGTPSPSSTLAPAPTMHAPVIDPIVRRPVVQYRVLGVDGLVGGIVFGTNVP